MQVLLKDDCLVLVPKDEAESAALADWKILHAGHVLHVAENDGVGLSLADLGPLEAACREPINVISTHPDPMIRLIANFAPTPFMLDSRRYASVESFWQSLKFDDERERAEISRMDGSEAKHAGQSRGYGPTVRYDSREIIVGTRDHWDLMERACRAKFDQHDGARAALLATAPRPLIHRVRHDSQAIPGIIMADIWMRIRDELGRK